MKKYILILFVILFFSGAIVSCNFLDENSLDKIELKKTLKTEEEAIAFMYGAYALVKNTVFGNDYISVTDLMTDDLDFSSTDISRRGLSFLTYNNNNKNIKALWGKLYAVIEQVNILINNLEKYDNLSKNGGDALMAESKFIRAWAYLQLVQLWGEVPLLTVPVYDIKKDNIFPERASLDKIYAQIVGDLEFAADKLNEVPPSITVRGEIQYTLAIRKSAAKLLLSKTYQLLNQWEEVIETLSYFGSTADQLNDEFGLVSEFAYIFDTRYKTIPERKLEILWEMEADASEGLNNTLHRDMAPKTLKGHRGEDLIGKSTGYQNYIPTLNLIQSFNMVKDKRYLQGYQLAGSAPDSRPQIMKGYDVDATNQNLAGATFVLLRVADAYLTIAEAYNEMGVPDIAKGFVDIIRDRAGLDPLPSNLTQEQMADSILLERRHEFAHEGAYRLFDLRRTGKYKEIMEAYQKEQSYLLLGEDEFGNEIPTTIRLIETANGVVTSDINIPFVKVNKIWQDKHLLHAIPLDERVANKNIVVENNWN